MMMFMYGLEFSAREALQGIHTKLKGLLLLYKYYS